jgi:NAD(P)-dependent dehydrogenase (short-subunit alcohol dehydrogenase family)
MTETRPNAVVIGYGPGVGAAVARAFAGDGCTFALVARNPDKLRTAALELNERGHDAAGFAADAGDEASLTSALAEARGRFGAPDVLVYNAAHWRPGLPWRSRRTRSSTICGCAWSGR